MSAQGRAFLSWLLWAVTVVVLCQQVAAHVRSDGVPISGNDFPAFYCAGTAVLAHADPYAVEPLRSCEHALPQGSDLPRQYVTPAPLPPYALDLFALLAELPYRIAAWIAFGILGAGFIWLAVALGRVTQLPSGAIAASLLFSAGLSSLVFGQIPSLATLAVVLCGAALVRGDDARAALWAAAATIEPHIGAPVAISLFLFRPAARAWLLGFGALCAAASVLAVTPHGALAYLTTVLPAHARAELLTVDQFSLSHLLAIAGASDRMALALGTISYLLTLALGVVAASAASRRLDVAALAFIPAATSLLAGTFVHQIELVAALPAAFLCISRGTPALAWTGRLVVAVVAAVPFIVALENRPLVDALALFCAGGALIGAVPFGETLDFTHTLGGFVLAASVVAFPLAVEHVTLPTLAPRAPIAATLPASSDASDNWGAYLRSDPRYATPRLDAEAAKLPVWLGLLALLSVTLGTVMARLGPTTQPAWDPRPRIHLS